MNVESYDLDSLRKLIRDLQAENKELKELLDKADIPYASSEVFDRTPDKDEEYDQDQGARIIRYPIDEKLANRFYGMFWGRQDVYAKRAKSGGYFPQCKNRWNSFCPIGRNERRSCSDDCGHKNFEKLEEEFILHHLRGYDERKNETVIGVYPLFLDDTCRFLVFDFDNHKKGAEKTDFANEDDAWHDEVDALRLICQQNNIDALVERSRSGRGAHVWILFSKPVLAATARKFGLLLLEKGAAKINLKSFRFYDRMFPSQDTAKSIGNLIALPLQGQALVNGNSAFVDKNWNTYSNQWEKLFQTKKLAPEEVEEYIKNWQNELPDYRDNKERPKPWKRQDHFIPTDVEGELHIVLANGVYIDALNIKPRLQNQFRCLATFDNPEYYTNKRLGYSNYDKFSTIYMGADVDGYIKIPRGLMEKVVNECEKSGINYNISDQREKGTPIRVSFNGDLRIKQDLAVQQLLAYDNGILSAATAFGKTVVCSYMISKRKVNTLILLENTTLIKQWEDALNQFLIIDEEPPEYQTPKGQIKKRKSVIGTLQGGKDTMTVIVDIAMIGSLYKKGAFHRNINSYGMIIMDECHHAAASTAQEVLSKINAKYVYGVSATPKRNDNLENICYMLLGQIRYKYTAKERTEDQGIPHYIIPRFTRVINISGNDDIHNAYTVVSGSAVRNDLIIEDVRNCINQGRTPVILTKFKEHAKFIYNCVVKDADYVFILYGDNSTKENVAIRSQLSKIPDNKSLILIATGQMIGEGFDFPRLNTLMLTEPISGSERLEQYVGRLSREYEGKNDVIVYDYVDLHIWQFEKMYLKRLKTYKKIGFKVVTDLVVSKQEVNSIFDSGNYTAVFEQDLIEANKEIVISSPQLTQNKINRFILIMKKRQEAGVKITVITQNPENNIYHNAAFTHALIGQLKTAGINVMVADGEIEHFAVIDQLLVWHGGIIF